MGFNKLIKQLQNALSRKERGKDVSRERIDTLLDKLEKKEKQLRKKLDKEKNPKKRKDLMLQVKIVITQRKKGAAVRRKL